MDLTDKNQPQPVPQFEDSPLTRAEYIAALTHFYRAEMDRATVWRVRLDTTTNWSIISVMALVSFVMGSRERSQIGIVVGMMLVFTFLVIEARRFRFFDVWRSRVRMLEQNFMGPILLRNQFSPVLDWGKKVADDLLCPRYKLTWHQALRIRLIRNYLPMFILLLACWLAKMDAMPAPLEGQNLFQVFWQPLEYGGIPVGVTFLVVVSLYGYLLGVILLAKRKSADETGIWNDDLPKIRDFDR